MYSNNKKINVDETKLIYDLLPIFKFENPVMIDVGAYDGGMCYKFASSNWYVYAFEPNPERYKYIENIIKKNPSFKLTLERFAVNDKEEKNLTFYLSNQSKGISSLTNFHSTHYKASFKVDSIRLDTYISNKNITKVNYLKIDTEGHDFFVLKSFPWQKINPEIIECEFEDLKTDKKLNYKWDDMANFLMEKGYTIIISEWYPIKRYGISHDWNCFKIYPCKLDSYEAWGNFICFKDKRFATLFKNKYKKFFKN
tara:strand:- start:2520 stop:3281 length:762 start_codon:yes stop_codon:yes gene_type:complete